MPLRSSGARGGCNPLAPSAPRGRASAAADRAETRLRGFTCSHGSRPSKERRLSSRASAASVRLIPASQRAGHIGGRVSLTPSIDKLRAGRLRTATPPQTVRHGGAAPVAPGFEAQPVTPGCLRSARRGEPATAGGFLRTSLLLKPERGGASKAKCCRYRRGPCGSGRPECATMR